MQNPIKVQLLDSTQLPVKDLGSFAALTCYNPELPELGKKIDVMSRLFETGHHTTLEHSQFVFVIEGIAVGDVTFGLHLTHPFYNSDQRSGRFCIDMFSNPDYAGFENYIKSHWPEVDEKTIKEVLQYIKDCCSVFESNQEAAIAKSIELFRQERPFYPEKNLEANCKKIAQEQLRAVIPIIFPTALVYTIDFITLVSMWKAAWNPVMRSTLDQMRDLVLKKNPEMSACFDEETRMKQDWSANIRDIEGSYFTYKPEVFNVVSVIDRNLLIPPSELQHPLDVMHFRPEMMSNNNSSLTYNTHLSIATYGQDQRHRTIKRGEPKFTGSFYIPPIINELGIEKELSYVMESWIAMSKKIPATLALILAPYGAMITYKKSAPINALLHESAKRLCFCAQEEIYEVSRQLRNENLPDYLTNVLIPPCYKGGKCLEGPRFCGRDLSTDEWFIKRKV